MWLSVPSSGCPAVSSNPPAPRSAVLSALRFLPEAFPAPLAAPFGYCPYRPCAWQGSQRLSHTGQPPGVPVRISPLFSKKISSGTSHRQA